MRSKNRLILAAALIGLAGISMLGIASAETKPADRKRLDRLKTTWQEDQARARMAYNQKVNDANHRLSLGFNSVIGDYKDAGDNAAAEVIQKELDELLATAQVDAVAPTDDPTGSSATSGNLDLIRMIGPKVVNAEGEKLDSRQLAGVKHVMLYFSAEWCGPCKKFTPKLVEYFNSVADSKQVMVVLVSRDNSPAEMTNYMKSFSMPWVAIPYDRVEASGVMKKYAGRGIPNLVLLNLDGTVKSGSYEGEKYVGPNKVLEDLKSLMASPE
jgi:nucleoredoxin